MVETARDGPLWVASPQRRRAWEAVPRVALNAETDAVRLPPIP